MAPHLIVSRDRVEMAERVAITVGSYILENPRGTIGVAVGATPALTYRHITSFAVRGVIDLSGVHWVLWDEFYQTKKGDSENSLTPCPHYNELSKTLFNLASIDNKRVVRPAPALSPEQALSEYSEMVQVRSPGLLIVGLGPKGNIGWVSSPHMDTSVHQVDITEATFEENIGMKEIMQADQVLLLAVARNKAQVVADIMRDKEGKTPAAKILLNHPCAKLFLDVKAASLLPQSVAPAPSELKGFRIINDPEAISGKKIICFSPHPDDTSISAGASLSFFAQNNTVISCCATTGHRAFIPDTNREERIAIREAEATAEAQHLDALAHFLRLPLYDRGTMFEDDIELMSAYLTKQNPDIIFLPHTGDAHPTHRAVLKTVLESLVVLLNEKDTPRSYELYMYEGPWSLFTKGSYNTIISTPGEFHAKKQAAIRAHKSQTGRTPYDVAGNALSQLRGALVPEQDLSGFGGEPPRLEERLEIFYHVTASSPADVQPLINLVNEGKPPSAL